MLPVILVKDLEEKGKERGTRLEALGQEGRRRGVKETLDQGRDGCNDEVSLTPGLIRHRILVASECLGGASRDGMVRQL